MEINFNTDKLVVLVFQGGAGGKFLSLCLNLNHNVLIQDERLAKIQMRMKDNTKFSHELALRSFNKKHETSTHHEYGCMELAGFNSSDLDDNRKLDQNLASNGLFKELTNQDKFFFFMVDHTNFDLFKDYPNRKTIRLHNYKWILDDRGIEFKQRWAEENEVLQNQGFWFDMGSTKDSGRFNDEISSASRYLGLAFDQAERLEILRRKFLQTLKIGFDNKEETQ